MSSSTGPIRTIGLYAAATVTSVSFTAIVYRCFWYKEEFCPSKSGYWPRLPALSKKKKNRILVKPPLRHVTPRPGEQPRIVYLTGIDKQTGEDELVGLFSSGVGEPPIEIDASEISFQKGGGRAWALYKSPEDAKHAVAALHSQRVRGCVLCARLEWGVEKNGKRITDKTVHTAIVRGIQRRRGTPKKVENDSMNGGKRKGKYNKTTKLGNSRGNEKSQKEHMLPVATYAHNSISIGETEYPFPSGIYSTKLIQRLSTTISASYRNDFSGDISNQATQHEQDAKLLRLLSDVSILGCGSVNRYAKEISEAFAMVDALERGIKLAFGITTIDLKGTITCYCLGDGKYPIGAAALELFLPKSNENDWKFIAIDPLLPKGDNGTSMFHKRIQLVSGFSQDYSIYNSLERLKNGELGTKEANGSTMMSIVIACHSHAPLEEFWERVPTPKLCVAMPCCAQFSELPKETPVLEYDNYEVYSPKRKIKIFASV